ncbi:MAG: TetR/AcrR family transcriptional regulator [Silicimonas sp.]|nr:TetR/AcrR family transcriptional regulator [Silicimonas sp.]NND22147.1 TetR/AcrR family transcriptional regulator [Silicimonas sp.]NNF91639.1 TetR/AcrR family transcriptional regulator [Boseongicola sp.]
MAARKGETAERILVAAREVVRAEGPDRLTFDAVADKVGVSKQAVLYWYPNKARLIEALVRPALESESAAGRGAVNAKASADAAIRAFVTALAVFHTSDLDRFRLMYVTPQIGRRPGRNGQMLTTLGRIHPATTAMYDRLAERLVEDGRYPRLVDARRASVAIHTALLGLILRMAMADALNAPLRLKDDALVDALVGVMVPPIRAA